jgi:hypothetical protein
MTTFAIARAGAPIRNSWLPDEVPPELPERELPPGFRICTAGPHKRLLVGPSGETIMLEPGEFIIAATDDAGPQP